MHSSDRVLARRYAQALFLSAAEHKQEERVRQELAEAFRALLPKLDDLKSPTLGAPAKKALVKHSVTGASPRTLHFLELLIDKKRVALLPAILSDLGRILDEHAGRVRAHVRSASELSTQQLDALVKRLKVFSGKDVAAEVKVDPELIGGVVVRMGDTVLDGSIQGHLRRLAAKLVEE